MYVYEVFSASVACIKLKEHRGCLVPCLGRPWQETLFWSVLSCDCASKAGQPNTLEFKLSMKFEFPISKRPINLAEVQHVSLSTIIPTSGLHLRPVGAPWL
jgi:hypothetical protein